MHIPGFKCKLAINNISLAVSLADQLSLQWQMNPLGVEPPLGTTCKGDGKTNFLLSLSLVCNRLAAVL